MGTIYDIYTEQELHHDEPEDITYMRRVFAGEVDVDIHSTEPVDIIFNMQRVLSQIPRNLMQMSHHQQFIWTILHKIFGSKYNNYIDVLQEIAFLPTKTPRYISFLAAMRRHGKTYGSALLALVCLAFIPSVRIIIAGPNRSTSEEMFGLVRLFVGIHTPHLEQYRIEDNKSRMTFRLSTDDKRTLFIGEVTADKLRGKSGEIIFMDEAAAADLDYIWRGIMPIASPDMNVITFMSTYNSSQDPDTNKAGFWFEEQIKSQLHVGDTQEQTHYITVWQSICQKCIEQDKIQECRHFRPFTANAHPTSKETILRKMMPTVIALEELDGIAAGHKLSETIKAALSYMRSPKFILEPSAMESRVKICVDPHGNGESSCMAIVASCMCSDDDGEQSTCILALIEMLAHDNDIIRQNLLEVVEHCERICTGMPIYEFVIEESMNSATNIGDIALGLDIAHGRKCVTTGIYSRTGIRVGVRCTYAYKRQMYSKTCEAFINRQITLHHNYMARSVHAETKSDVVEILRRQVQDFDGVTQLCGKHRGLRRDDLFIAFMMSIFPYELGTSALF